jgi:hypothetical protein
METPFGATRIEINIIKLSDILPTTPVGPENPILAESRPLIETHPHWWGPRAGVGIDTTAFVSAALYPP